MVLLVEVILLVKHLLECWCSVQAGKSVMEDWQILLSFFFCTSCVPSRCFRQKCPFRSYETSHLSHLVFLSPEIFEVTNEIGDKTISLFYYVHVYVRLWMVLLWMVFSIDATRDNGSLGRLVNDGTGHSENAVMKIVKVGEIPRLCLFAKRDISLAEEIRYDYGVDDLPWREVRLCVC